MWAHQYVGALVLGGMVMFWLVATCRWHAAFRHLTRSAVIFAGTMLAAMFADVFVQHTIGYVLVVAALIAFYCFVSGDERDTDTSELHSVLLHERHS